MRVQIGYGPAANKILNVHSGDLGNVGILDGKISCWLLDSTGSPVTGSPLGIPALLTPDGGDQEAVVIDRIEDGCIDAESCMFDIHLAAVHTCPDNTLCTLLLHSPPPPPHPPLFPAIAPPLAPFPPTVPGYPAGTSTTQVIISLIVKNFRCADAAATAVKVAKRFSAPTANVACGGASTRRRRLTDDLSLTITIPTIAANHDAVLNSATTLFQDEEAATALLGASVYSGSATVTDTSNGGADKDPHLAFPHGGTADFRGRNGIYYSFLSSPGLAVNVKTEARGA